MPRFPHLSPHSPNFYEKLNLFYPNFLSLVIKSFCLFAAFLFYFLAAESELQLDYLFKLIMGPFTSKSKTTRRAFKQTATFSNSQQWSHSFCRICGEIICLNYKGVILIHVGYAPHCFAGACNHFAVTCNALVSAKGF